MTETTCIPVIVHGDKGQITEIPAGQLPADLPAGVIDTLKVLGAISESAPPAKAAADSGTDAGATPHKTSAAKS